MRTPQARFLGADHLTEIVGGTVVKQRERFVRPGTRRIWSAEADGRRGGQRNPPAHQRRRRPGRGLLGVICQKRYAGSNRAANRTERGPARDAVDFAASAQGGWTNAPDLFAGGQGRSWSAAPTNRGNVGRRRATHGTRRRWAPPESPSGAMIADRSPQVTGPRCGSGVAFR